VAAPTTAATGFSNPSKPACATWNPDNWSGVYALYPRLHTPVGTSFPVFFQLCSVATDTPSAFATCVVVNVSGADISSLFSRSVLVVTPVRFFLRPWSIPKGLSNFVMP